MDEGKPARNPFSGAKTPRTLYVFMVVSLAVLLLGSSFIPQRIEGYKIEAVIESRSPAAGSRLAEQILSDANVSRALREISSDQQPPGAELRRQVRDALQIHLSAEPGQLIVSTVALNGEQGVKLLNHLVQEENDTAEPFSPAVREQLSRQRKAVHAAEEQAAEALQIWQTTHKRQQELLQKVLQAKTTALSAAAQSPVQPVAYNDRSSGWTENQNAENEPQYRVARQPAYTHPPYGNRYLEQEPVSSTPPVPAQGNVATAISDRAALIRKLQELEARRREMEDAHPLAAMLDDEIEGARAWLAENQPTTVIAPPVQNPPIASPAIPPPEKSSPVDKKLSEEIASLAATLDILKGEWQRAENQRAAATRRYEQTAEAAAGAAPLQSSTGWRLFQPAAVRQIMYRSSTLAIFFLIIVALGAGIAAARGAGSLAAESLLRSVEQIAALIPVVGVIGNGPRELPDLSAGRRRTIRIVLRSSEVILAVLVVVLLLGALLESSLVEEITQRPSAAVGEALSRIFSK